MTPDEEILRLLRAGYTDRQAGRAAQASRARIRRLRAEHQIPHPAPGHGTTARWQRGCRCDPCHEARLAQKRAEYERRGPIPSTMPPDRSAALYARGQALQAETAAAATRARAAWTEEDLAVALDYQHTAAEAAHLLGRTLAAVRHVRRKRQARPVVLPYRPRKSE